MSASGAIATFAGTGTAGYNGDGIAAKSAQLSAPWGLAVGLDGSLYIADSNNNRVRKVSGGKIATLAGSQTLGFTGDGGPTATAATLATPVAVAVDPAGDVYIADSDNNRVRKVYASGANAGNIATISGINSEQFDGDGNSATLASLYGPYALALDGAGDLFVADLFHNRIREISATQITLPRSDHPGRQGVAAAGGAAGGRGQRGAPADAVRAGDERARPGHDDLLRERVAGGRIRLRAGRGVRADRGGHAGDRDHHGGQQRRGHAAGGDDDRAGAEREPDLDYGDVEREPEPGGAGGHLHRDAEWRQRSDRDGQLPRWHRLRSDDLVQCNAAGVAAGLHGDHADAGQPRDHSGVYSGDAQDAAATSAVLTQVVQQQPVYALSVGPNPATVGATVTLTLTLTATVGTPSGTVTFYDGTAAIGSAGLNGGVATITTASLTVGTHSITAKYSGDAADSGGVSNAVSEVIQAETTATLLGTSNASISVGTAVTFTATVSNGSSTAPTGSVQFTAGGVVLGSAPVNAAGVATLTTSALPPGALSVVAAYGGDLDDQSSSSTPLLETVSQDASSTTLAASANPVSAGATLTLTATVTAAPGSLGGAVTGNVTFTDGANTLGSASVNSSGQAAINISTLSVGTHTIVATYAGSTNYAGSASSTMQIVVQQTGTAVALSSAANPTLAGEPVNLTITVTSSTGTPTGTVTIKDGGVSLGSSSLNGSGVATFSTSSLAVGVHTLTAVYSGDSFYTANTSAALQQTISLATTSVTLSGPGAPVNAGVAITVSATLTTNGVAPTGTMMLLDGTTSIASQTVTGAGTFNFAGLTLAVGTHSLTAAYTGDADNAKATSAIVIVVVQQGTSTLTLSSSANPQTQGQSVTFTATVTSASPNATGSVTLADGGTVLATVPLNASGVATFSTSALAVGSHAITAVYGGDTNHAASNTASLTELIVQTSTATLGSSLNPAPAGAAVTFTAKIAGAGGVVPTGSVTFTDGANLLGSGTLDAAGSASVQTSALSVGSHTVTVSYAGDKNYFSSSATLIETIQSASTQIVLTGNANPATYGQPVTFTATITTNGGVATGNVSFTVDGLALGTGLLNASGVATITTSSLTPGPHSIVANYAGDGKAGATTSVPLVISVLETTGVAVTASANPAQTLSAVTLTATVTNAGVGVPSGSVTFSDGATGLGSVTLSAAGTATLTVAQFVAGTHTITVSYPGDADNFPATSPALSETVNLRATTTSVSGTPNSTTNAQQVLLIGVVSGSGPTAPGGTITFTNGSQTLGSATIGSGGIATLTVVLQAGTNNIVATYNGDANYASSASTQTNISGGTVTQFSMTLTPATMTLQSKQHGTSTLTLASVAGFSDTMQFGCLGLPVDATCTFSQTAAGLSANGTLSVQVTVDTGDPLGAGASAMNRMPGRSGLGSAPVIFFSLLPGGLLLGFGLRRRMKRALLPMLLVVFAVALTVSATGCGGLQVNGTPAGNYSFKVTASGEGSGVTQSQVMTLTVTQ